MTNGGLRAPLSGASTTASRPPRLQRTQPGAPGHAAAAAPSAARSSASQALVSTWRPRRRLQDTARSRSRAMRTGSVSSAASGGAAAPRGARHAARACSSSSLSPGLHRPLQGPVTAADPGARPCQAFGSRSCMTRMQLACRSAHSSATPCLDTPDIRDLDIRVLLTILCPACTGPCESHDCCQLCHIFTTNTSVEEQM
jgi:hypothetical protein